MHSLVSSYERMLSRAFIFPAGASQIADLHREPGILLPSLTAGNTTLYLYVFINFSMTDSPDLQTTLFENLEVCSW